jgi:hypothetical protein
MKKAQQNKLDPQSSVVKPADISKATALLQNRIIAIYRALYRDIKHNARKLLKMAGDDGPVAAVITLVQKGPTTTFLKLRNYDRLDLAVESLVLRPEFQCLFDPLTKMKAKQNLELINDWHPQEGDEGLIALLS